MSIIIKYIDLNIVFVPKDVFPRCVDGRSRRRLRRPVRRSHEGRLGQVHR